MANVARQFWMYPAEVDKSSLIFELSATTDVNVVYGSAVTSHPVPDGQDVADNVVLEPTTITMQGRLSDVFDFTGDDSNVVGIPVVESFRTLPEYIEQFKKLLRDKIDWVVVLPTIDETKNMICTSFEISKTPELGGNAWDVSLDLQQVRTATQAELVAAPAEPFAIAAKTSASGNSTGVTPEGAAVACDLKSSGSEYCETSSRENKEGQLVIFYADGTNYNTVTEEFGFPE